MMHRFTVIIPKELYHKLLEIHHQKKLEGNTKATMSDTVREALEVYLKNSARKPQPFPGIAKGRESG